MGGSSCDFLNPDDGPLNVGVDDFSTFVLICFGFGQLKFLNLKACFPELKK